MTLTAQALAGAGIRDAGELIRDYCLWPDLYFGPRSEEVAPYMFFTDGIQFHYPPHTPVEDLYRYWSSTPEGFRLVRPGSDDNLRHFEAGTRFYLEKTVALLRSGERGEAWKYLGCLLHFLEDSAFGLHALEGPDGTDAFVLDRLSGREVAKYICGLEIDDTLKTLTLAPRILSDDIEEAVALLYARYVRAAADSRRALFDIAAGFLYGKSRNTLLENTKTMFLNALGLATDAAATAAAVAEGRAPKVAARRLAEFSPFFYPIGGAGGFALRRYEETDDAVTFGVNGEAVLLYRVPRNVYRLFTARIRPADTGPLTFGLVNDGVCARRFDLAGSEEFSAELPSPAGTVGFHLVSPAPRGTIRIESGTFLK